MFKLSDKPVKEEYKAHANQNVLLGKDEVRVILQEVQTKSGSWERGFKFGSITYGILQRVVKQPKKSVDVVQFSADHGKTWHESIRAAKKSKGKIIVERPAPRGEFAFSAIQKINREYDPDYKWKP